MGQVSNKDTKKTIGYSALFRGDVNTVATMLDQGDDLPSLSRAVPFVPGSMKDLLMNSNATIDIKESIFFDTWHYDFMLVADGAGGLREADANDRYATSIRLANWIDGHGFALPSLSSTILSTISFEEAALYVTNTARIVSFPNTTNRFHGWDERHGIFKKFLLEDRIDDVANLIKRGAKIPEIHKHTISKMSERVHDFLVSQNSNVHKVFRHYIVRESNLDKIKDLVAKGATIPEFGIFNVDLTDPRWHELKTLPGMGVEDSDMPPEEYEAKYTSYYDAWIVDRMSDGIKEYLVSIGSNLKGILRSHVEHNMLDKVKYLVEDKNVMLPFNSKFNSKLSLEMKDYFCQGLGTKEMFDYHVEHGNKERVQYGFELNNEYLSNSSFGVFDVYETALPGADLYENV